MSRGAAPRQRSRSRAGIAVRERLEARREEIETAALTRVKAISDPAEVADPAYAEGLRVAVAAAVSYGIETTGREAGDPPIPVALLAQARMAARVGIPLDTVLRRYFAGYSLLGYFILEEAAQVGITDSAELRRQLGIHAGTFDRLLAAIAEEYGRESETQHRSTEHRRAELIERLLAGELVDTAEIPYDFEGWHLGVVAAGAGAERQVRELAQGRDCRLLVLPREGEVLWAWLGARRRLDPENLLDDLKAGTQHDGTTIALGEAAERLPGWQFTHRQAQAALGVAQRGGEKHVRYADVAVLASALNDDLLAKSLRRLYLDPLKGERDGGQDLRNTLRAYYAANGSLVLAGSKLGVSRRTIANRIRRFEDLIGKPLLTVAAEVHIALHAATVESAETIS